MQLNNNIIHNSKKKYGKDYLYYEETREANYENHLYKNILQELLDERNNTDV